MREMIAGVDEPGERAGINPVACDGRIRGAELGQADGVRGCISRRDQWRAVGEGKVAPRRAGLLLARVSQTCRDRELVGRLPVELREGGLAGRNRMLVDDRERVVQRLLQQCRGCDQCIVLRIRRVEGTGVLAEQVSAVRVRQDLEEIDAGLIVERRRDVARRPQFLRILLSVHQCAAARDREAGLLVVVVGIEMEFARRRNRLEFQAAQIPCRDKRSAVVAGNERQRLIDVDRRPGTDDRHIAAEITPGEGGSCRWWRASIRRSAWPDRS